MANPAAGAPLGHAALGTHADPRPTCVRCHKPAVSCVCASVKRIANQTRITIFQHPRERFHPLGTARFAELGLANSRLFVTHRHLPPPAPALHERAVLLYPDHDVPELSQLPYSVSEVVVVDGTWHHAKTLLRDLPILRSLPRARLRPAATSRYRLRREPRQECISTIEAILLALRTLEPELAGTDQLLAAFDTMIDRQIELAATRKRCQRAPARRRTASLRLLPRAFAEDWQRLVVVYLERVPTPRGREIIQWVAWRARDGEGFEAYLPIPEAANPLHVAQSQRPDQVHTRALDEVRQSFRQFTGPRPLLAAWHQRTLDAMSQSVSGRASTCIKSVHRRLYPSLLGTLEHCVAQHGLAVPLAPAGGRAGKRLGDAVALVRHLAGTAQGNMPAPE